MTNKRKRSTIKVLIVEDEPILVRMYETVLRRQRYLVITATEEEAGLKAIRNERPTIILLDLMIPSLKRQRDTGNFHEPVGFEVLKFIRSNPATRQTKVIVLTNLDADEHRRRARELGADDYVVKAQVLPRELTDHIQRLLAKT